MQFVSRFVLLADSCLAGNHRMKSSVTLLVKFLLFKPYQPLISPLPKSRFFSAVDSATTSCAPPSTVLSGTQSTNQVEQEVETGPPKDAADVFRVWGCGEEDIDRIFTRRPSLRNSNLANLESKLRLLRRLGLKPSELVCILHRCPRFLSYSVNRNFEERLDYLESFFGSRQLLIKAIVTNPSMLTYDFQQKFTPVFDMYGRMGICKADFISMLLSRPTLVPRSRICEDKLDYIDRTGVKKDSKMHKYVVAIMAVSRIETIRAKIAHLQKFGLSEAEVLDAYGRSPFLLTLSIDKVQRNMTFVVATMKLPAKIVLRNPFLLLSNLETTLMPRWHLGNKIEDMGLVPQMKGPTLLTALRMTEKRLLKAYVTCHPQDVRDELLDCYRNAKDVKRLAESSRRNLHAGFPF